MSAQLSLLTDVQRRERPWKRQRGTARQVERDRRAADRVKQAAGVETREGQVLRILGWHWHVTQTSPTALELLAWARAQGERMFDVNSIRPRLHALTQQGLVAPGEKRACSISGKTVLTWRVREIGSEEPR